METFDTSSKIKCLIEMALNGEISWFAIDPVKLTPTLEKARQIIKILLKEFETHQSICAIKASNDNYGIDYKEDICEDQSITEEVKIIQESNYEEVGIDFTEKKLVSEQLMKIRSEEMFSAESEQDFTKEALEISDDDSKCNQLT